MCFLFLQSLALAHVDVADGKVFFSPWSETDFRTGENPWWSWAHTSFPLIISKYTICRRIYLHSNLGLDSDDVHWDKLFIEWQILLNCCLISLFSSHDLNWKHGFKFLLLGKYFIDILYVGRISKETLWQTCQRKLIIVPLFLWTKNIELNALWFQDKLQKPMSGLSIWHSSRSLEC